jgi:hypothetical protein
VKEQIVVSAAVRVTAAVILQTGRRMMVDVLRTSVEPDPTTPRDVELTAPAALAVVEN